MEENLKPIVNQYRLIPKEIPVYSLTLQQNVTFVKFSDTDEGLIVEIIATFGDYFYGKVQILYPTEHGPEFKNMPNGDVIVNINHTKNYHKPTFHVIGGK